MPLFKKLDTPSVSVAGRENIPNILRMLSDLSRNLDAILNRGMRPELNMDLRQVTVTSHATPGTEFSVAHGLGKRPAGYKVYGQNGAGTLYDGTTGNTNATLYLRCNAGSVTFKIEVF